MDRAPAVVDGRCRGYRLSRPDSDVDILVDFAEPATFGRFMELKFTLEDLLGRPVDLVTVKALRPRLAEAISAERVDVA